MAITTPQAVNAVARRAPTMRWVVEFDKITPGGSNIFTYGVGLKFDLAQIEWVLEGMIERRLGTHWLPDSHDWANLRACHALVGDLLAYGQNAIAIAHLEAMSPLGGGDIVPFKRFLYIVWFHYTNRCNLCRRGSRGGKPALKPREIVYRDEINREIVCARGKVYAGRWVNKFTGKPIRMPETAVFSHTEEWNFATMQDNVRANLLEERRSPTAVIDLTVDEEEEEEKKEEEKKEEEKEPEPDEPIVETVDIGDDDGSLVSQLETVGI